MNAIDARLLTAMIQQSPIGVGIFRRPDSVIEMANPAICQIWGRVQAEVLGRPLFTALPEAAGQGWEERLTGVYETGIAFVGHELPATLHRSGKLDTVYFDFVYEPMREADGSIERIMVVATDATAIREVRQTLELSETRYRELNHELETRVLLRTQNLARSNLDLMQFASVASHDLKEPLRKITTFAGLLEERLVTRLDDTERDLFRRLINATNRMNLLVSDVLRLSILSNQTISYERVSLDTIMDQIREDLELLIDDRRAEVTNDALPTVLAMPGQMHQLLQNLISNALKFNTNAVPTVHVSAHTLTDALVAELSLPNRQYAVLTVTDNGIGFDQHYADTIFGMFQRLHGRNEYTGTGIGLTIVKRIVENHRGFVNVESRPGQGTTFRLVLRLAM